MSEAPTVADQVPRDAPCNAEIGFAVPPRYNASAILFDNLMASSGRCALTGPAGSRTYAELAADACCFGAGLLSLGLRRGDRVLLFLDDTPAYPAAVFGAIRAGLVPLLINTLTPPDLLQFYGSQLDPAWKTLDLIENTEETIHKVIRRRNPGAKPPKLTCERTGPREVIVRYSSSRRMCGLAKGICRGLGAHFAEPVEVSEPACMLAGAPECRISVKLTGPGDA